MPAQNIKLIICDECQEEKEQFPSTRFSYDKVRAKGWTVLSQGSIFVCSTCYAKLLKDTRQVQDCTVEQLRLAALVREHAEGEKTDKVKDDYVYVRPSGYYE